MAQSGHSRLHPQRWLIGALLGACPVPLLWSRTTLDGDGGRAHHTRTGSTCMLDRHGARSSPCPRADSPPPLAFVTVRNARVSVRLGAQATQGMSTVKYVALFDWVQGGGQSSRALERHCTSGARLELTSDSSTGSRVEVGKQHTRRRQPFCPARQPFRTEHLLVAFIAVRCEHPAGVSLSNLARSHPPPNLAAASLPVFPLC